MTCLYLCGDSQKSKTVFSLGVCDATSTAQTVNCEQVAPKTKEWVFTMRLDETWDSVSLSRYLHICPPAHKQSEGRVDRRCINCSRLEMAHAPEKSQSWYKLSGRKDGVIKKGKKKPARQRHHVQRQVTPAGWGRAGEQLVGKVSGKMCSYQHGLILAAAKTTENSPKTEWTQPTSPSPSGSSHVCLQFSGVGKRIK